MINRLIEWAMRNLLAVGCATVLIVAYGIYALLNTPVDAIPDLSENQVLVLAEWPGRAAQEVETQITYPLSLNLQGLAGVKTVRAGSMFGFSLVTVVFNDDVRIATARQQILERLNLLGEKLPAAVQPKLGPDATGLGWIYQYYLDVDRSRSPKGGFDLGELRALQDSFIGPQLNSVPGVAEIASVGGFVRQYQIAVDVAKMRAAGVPLGAVTQAVEQGSRNVGGNTIEENGMEFVVRGIGSVRNADDLGKIVLTESVGAPILLRDIASVQLGGDFRQGALDVNGSEAVGGIVVMRTGENARDVIRGVKARIARLQPSLPDGVTIRPFYDRGELIDRSLDTLKRALTEQVLLVILAHIIFLWHFRSILVVTLPLPVSILISLILMRQLGLSSNLMSLSFPAQWDPKLGIHVT